MEQRAYLLPMKAEVKNGDVGKTNDNPERISGLHSRDEVLHVVFWTCGFLFTGFAVWGEPSWLMGTKLAQA